MSNLSRTIQHLIDSGSLRRGEISGCTEDELVRLERAYGVALPATYREFLRYLGRATGPIFKGSNLHFDSLAAIREVAQIMVMNDELTETVVSLPDDAFPFMEHQAYQLWYFRLGEGDDPPVYYYLDDHPPVRTVATTFSEFILSEMHSIWHLSRE
jgi:hypothetical protein